MMESWKLMDCRAWDTSFRDIITPRIEVSLGETSRKFVDTPLRTNTSSNLLTLDDNERQKPSVVGKLGVDSGKQLMVTYTRQKDGTQVRVNQVARE